MASSRPWTIAPEPSDGDVLAIRQALGVGPVVARLLAQRAAAPAPAAARSFLQPSLADLVPPRLLPGMEAAVARLQRALKDRERVVVYADYDADGVTACALLLRIFRALGLPAGRYLPSRLEEGYGISDDFVRRAVEEKIDLVVTVDCGASEHERVGRLSAAGVDVIITDHHEPGDRSPPEALAVINPKLPGSDYPFRELAGVGVAFKLAWALCEKVSGSPKVGPRLREALLSLLPMVALGTIADVSPLTGENRIAVSHGLRLMHQACPGVRALLDVCNLANRELSVRHVAFNLSPRLNAAGRMGSADLAVDLLLEDDLGRARALALELDRQNNARQELCLAIQEEAEAIVRRAESGEAGNEAPGAPVTVGEAAVAVAAEGWHEGVIGIVAGRLAERLGRAAAVATLDSAGDRGRGSARGTGEINLFEVMSRTDSRLLTFGGHEQAAGFSFKASDWPAWSRAFVDECERQRGEHPAGPSLRIDLELSLGRLGHDLAAELDLLRPFGQGNPEPLFLARGVRITGSPKLLGRRQRHFAFNATQEGVGYRAVVFNRIEHLHAIDAGRLCWDIVYAPVINEYNGARRLELRIEDMRPSSDSTRVRSGRWRLDSREPPDRVSP